MMNHNYKVGDVLVFIQDYGVYNRYGDEVTVLEIDIKQDGLRYSFGDRTGYAFTRRFVPKSIFNSKLYQALIDGEPTND